MAPIVSSAAALPIAVALPEETQPYVLGGAFAVGTAVSVALQFAAVIRALGRVPLARPSAREMASSGKEGGLVILSFLPSWIYYRVQVGIAMSLLGPAATGLFIYAKQIANAAMQGLYFIRRAEFPGLMKRLDGRVDFTTVMGAHKDSLRFGVAVGLVMIVAGPLIWLWAPPEAGTAALVAASFGPAVLISAFYAALNQGYLGLKRTGTAAAVSNASVMAALLLSAPAVLWLGVYGLAFAEFWMNFAAFAALILLRKSRGGATPPRNIAENAAR
jgi:O-antigen/teichoic acid export membrane protein